jgi:hypothetical protein
MNECSADSSFNKNAHDLSDSGANLTACPPILSTILNVTPIILPEPIIIIFGKKTTAPSTSYLDFTGTILDRMYIIDSLPHCILSVPRLNRRCLMVAFTAKLMCEIIDDSSNSVIVSTPIDVERGLYFFDMTALLCPYSPLQTTAVIASRRVAHLLHFTKDDINAVMALHECINHPSVSVMARVIRDYAWTGLPSNITAALVERVYHVTKAGSSLNSWTWHRSSIPIHWICCFDRFCPGINTRVWRI